MKYINYSDTSILETFTGSALVFDKLLKNNKIYPIELLKIITNYLDINIQIGLLCNHEPLEKEFYIGCKNIKFPTNVIKVLQIFFGVPPK